MYSYCLNSENHILSIAPGDLSGCSDWYKGEIGLTNDELFDAHGAPLYKLVGGIAVMRPEEERMAEWTPEPEPEPTADDYREALEKLGVIL